jgi:hypothetical protein
VVVQVFVVLFVHVPPAVPFLRPRAPFCLAVASVQPKQFPASSYLYTS